MKNTAAIQIKDLVIDYGESIAVNSINLEINQGELITLLGPSGCGKSTTLNALAGLITPTSGDIIFNGKNVTKLSPKERKIGLVFQSYALYPHMTVYKNISFPLEASDDFKNEVKQHNKNIDFEVKKYIYSKTDNKDLEELEETIETYENTVVDLTKEIKNISFDSKNKIGNEKNLIVQNKVKRDARIKNSSKVTLQEIESNEEKAIELRSEIKNISSAKVEEEKKEKLISDINSLIQKTISTNNELLSAYEKKLKVIEEEYIQSKINLENRLKESIPKIKNESKEIINTKKNELKQFVLENKPKYLDAKKKIDEVVKAQTLNENDELEIKKINSKKLILKAEIDRKVREVAERVGITSQLEKKVTNLSGGQQQRVAISRTLIKNPDILLLDEPLSNLDAKMRVSTREWIRNLQQELNITTIFVTHDQEEAMSISDRIVCMSNGHIQQVENPMDMYHNPANKFVAGFMGMPQMNLFANKGKLEEQILKKLKLKDVSFGVRPEHVKYEKEIESKDDVLISFEGKVTLIEAFGRERMLTVMVEDEKVRLFTEDLKLKIGDKAKIAIRKGKLYTFNNDKYESVNSKI